MRMIRFRCPYCNRRLKVSQDKAGIRGRCPSCENIVHAPSLSSEPAASGHPPATDWESESDDGDDLLSTMEEWLARVEAEDPRPAGLQAGAETGGTAAPASGDLHSLKALLDEDPTPSAALDQRVAAGAIASHTHRQDPSHTAQPTAAGDGGREPARFEMVLRVLAWLNILVGVAAAVWIAVSSGGLAAGDRVNWHALGLAALVLWTESVLAALLLTVVWIAGLLRRQMPS